MGEMFHVAEGGRRDMNAPKGKQFCDFKSTLRKTWANDAHLSYY
jgi:hypothetical protein